MNDAARAALEYLSRLNIPLRLSEHAPTASMEDCAAVDRALQALTPKNIFLTTKNGRRFCLCLTRPEVRFRTADVSKQAGYSRLSFGPPDKLEALLRCQPGSASPLGLIFDEAHQVALLVDRALRDCPTLAFHPCDNTVTAAMAGRDFFEVFLPAVGVAPMDIDMT